MPHRDDELDDDRPRRPDPDDGYDDHYDRPPQRKKGMGLGAVLAIVGVLVVLCGGCLVGGAFFGTGSVRNAANRMKSSNNMKQMVLGVHNYHDTYDELPSNSFSPDGKPLLSWRVHVLPYVEQDNLYKQFKLDEPWDGPNNIRLLQSMPVLYMIPNQQGKTPPGFTHYRGFSSRGAVFDRRLVVDQKRPDQEKLTLAGIKDRPENTILIVEAADAVEWTKPDDLDAGPGKPFPKMGEFFRGKRFQAALVSGEVKNLRGDLAEETLRALVTHSGGEPLPPGWDQ